MRKQISVEDVRSFTIDQFEKVKDSKELKKLVHFHTINKYLFLTFNQKETRILGNLVANRENEYLDYIFLAYEEHLLKLLSGRPTIKTITNVLTKIYGHFKKKFSLEDKKKFLSDIEQYRQGNLTLGKVLNQVDGFVQKYDNGYMQRQTFYLLYSDIEFQSLD